MKLVLKMFVLCHGIKKTFEKEMKTCPSQKFKFNWNLSYKNSNINAFILPISQVSTLFCKV